MTGDLTGDLSTKRARVQDSGLIGNDVCVIRATAPLGELQNYSNQLKKLRSKSWASVVLSTTQLPGDTQTREHATVDVRTFINLEQQKWLTGEGDAGFWKGTRLGFDVRNLFDEEPPYVNLAPNVNGSGEDWRVSDHALWWPPSKIAGKRLAPYLALRRGTVARYAASLASLRCAGLSTTSLVMPPYGPPSGSASALSPSMAGVTAARRRSNRCCSKARSRSARRIARTSSMWSSGTGSPIKRS